PGAGRQALSLPVRLRPERRPLRRRREAANPPRGAGIRVAGLPDRRRQRPGANAITAPHSSLFSMADLSSVDLTNADLFWCCFQLADVRQARLVGANSLLCYTAVDLHPAE